MIKLTKSLNAWDSPLFESVFKDEVEQLGIDELPLQQGLSTTSYVTDAKRKVMVLGSVEDKEHLLIRAGIFYSGIIAGCSCEDDPTTNEDETEYCKVLFDIDRKTAEATATLLND